MTAKCLKEYHIHAEDHSTVYYSDFSIPKLYYYYEIEKIISRLLCKCLL